MPGITPTQIEAGDLVLVGRTDVTQTQTGFVVRPMAPGELATQANVPATCTGGLWWQSASGSLNGASFGPDEVCVILALFKSHKAVDDLGPYVGLADA